MMKNIIVALFALVMFTSCINNSAAKSEDKSSGCDWTNDQECSDVDCEICESVFCPSTTVEVLYMHGKQRCATCVAIGEQAEAFIKALGSDKVVMKTIDLSTPEGEKIADKYEIASSSLIVVRGQCVDNITPMSFQYAINNPEQFKKNLGEAIDKMLK